MVLDIDFREKKIILEPELIAKWAEPYHEEKLSNEKKRYILNNIYEYLIQNNSSERIELLIDKK